MAKAEKNDADVRVDKSAARQDKAESAAVRNAGDGAGGDTVVELPVADSADAVEVERLPTGLRASNNRRTWLTARRRR